MALADKEIKHLQSIEWPAEELIPDAAVLTAISGLPDPSRHELVRWLNSIAGELERHGSEILVTRERASVARDLHDEVGADLAAAVALFKYHFDLASRERDSGEVLARVFEILESTLGNVRLLIRTLRGPDFGSAGVLGALVQMADDYRTRRGLQIELIHSGSPEELSGHDQQVLFHVVREALANVYRHSGSPTCSINIDFAAKPFLVAIADQGSGFGEVPGKGYGLIGIKERAAGIDGRIEVISTPGRGTTVYLFGPTPTMP
jgi:signal transduction histidine kinase